MNNINNINKKFQIFVISGIILILLDFTYLCLNQNWYKQEIKKSQGHKLQLKWFGVLIRYLAQIIGLNLFILHNSPTLNKTTLINALLYGLIIYGNYLGTNYATITTFDEKLAIVDFIKGGSIMILTTFLVNKLT